MVGTAESAPSAEAERKRSSALEAADAARYRAVVATRPSTVRWLLCGRGRPVSTSGADADYTLVLADESAYALFPDIESSRVEEEEKLEELGYEPVPFPWYEGRVQTVRRLLDGRRPLAGGELEAAVAPSRRLLSTEERERYRTVGADAAAAMVACLGGLTPQQSELEAAAELSRQARLQGFFPPVVLVAGEQRQKLHRHPLPTAARLGGHALLAMTAERAGLHVSLTRIVSFGATPAELERVVAASAAVEAVMLAASRPGRTLGDVFGAAAAAYAAVGFPGEWQRHHQGGLTGYEGREVFAIPGEPTVIPPSCAVAWNPSVTGGGKSEDTALVTSAGVEVITRTTDLPEIVLDGLPRPAIVEL
jgi:Xaa-Pro aminopeptidase